MLIRKEFKQLIDYSSTDERLRVLLIRKEFKLYGMTYRPLDMFESLVNTEGIQTSWFENYIGETFESLVNTEGIQTFIYDKFTDTRFESLVNTEGIQTYDQK